MFGNLAISDSEDIDRNHGLRSPPGITAVNADIVTVRHDKTRFVFEVARQVSHQGLDRRGAVRNLWVVLPIIGTEQAINYSGIAFDENAPDPLENERLVSFGRSRHSIALRSWPGPCRFLLAGAS